MICSDCGSWYQGLACPECWKRKSLDAYQKQQRLFAPDVAAGRVQLRLARKAKSEPYCILLLEECQHSYCGRLLAPPLMRQRLRYPITGVDVCPTCLKALESIIRDTTYGIQADATEAATAH